MTDVELVVAAQAGDRGAVEALYAKYGRYVRANALRYGAGDDAEDVRQELFLRLMQGHSDWRGGTQAPGPTGELWLWLNIITRQHVHHQRRTWAARCVREALPDEDWSALVPLWNDVPKESPEARVLRLERIRSLLAAFAALPSRLRLVAYLRAVECLNFQEIAERLGTAKGTIGATLPRIRQRLRTALAGVYTLPPPGKWGFVAFRRSRTGQARSGRQRATQRRKRAQQRKARTCPGPRSRVLANPGDLFSRCETASPSPAGSGAYLPRCERCLTTDTNVYTL